MNKITPILLIAFLLLFNFSFSQRNNCDDNAAGEITVGATCTNQAMDSTNNSDYWDNAGSGTCGESDQDDVWMWFDATSTSTTINYTPAANRDAILTLFEGNCSTGMASVACSNLGGNGVVETINYATTFGTRYRIRVQRSGSNNNMTGNVCVYNAVASSCHPFTYCTNTYGNAVEAITNVTFAGINNTTAAGTAGGDQEILCSSAAVDQGGSYAISVNGDTEGAFTNNITAFFDWNQDGDFADANERYDIGTINNNDGTGTPATNTIAVPAGATLGTTSMRIIKNYNAYATDSCTPGSGYGQTEDYLVAVSAVAACSTPTAQASALNLSPTDTTIGGTFTAAAPAPDNYLVVMNTTGTTPAPADTTTYTIGGTVGAGNTVVDIDGDTSFTATGLTPSTTYYFFIFSYNDACTGGPLYYTTSPLTGNTTTLAASYCTPAPTSVDGTGITNVTFSTVNNTTGAEAGNYGDYSAMIGSGVQGATLNVDITYETGYTYDTTIWVDWNDDGDFADAGETVYTGESLAANPTTLNASFTIPIAATTGNHRMRIGGMDFGPMTDPCYTGTYACFEDYTLNVIATGPCSTPTAQATGLILSPSGTTINGTFTAAAPAPDSYLVVANTSGVAPTPVDGTTYTIGGSLGAGNIIIDTDTDTSFSTSPLTASTTYYFFVFSYNGLCSGGPLYYNTSPLTGNATTGSVSYCTPVTSTDPTARYIDDVEFIGTLNDVSNFGSGAATGPAGYQDFTGLANSSQQQGEGMNVYVAGDSRGHFKAWIDWNQDGTFDQVTEEVYDSGGIGTTSTTFGYTIPVTQPIGTYTLRVRFYNSYKASNPGAGTESYAYDFDACETFDSLAGYTEHGEAEDYTFDVVARCDAQITDIVNGEACGTLETVDLNVTGAGNVTSFHWYANETGGAPLATTATGSWTTPAIATTTTYWVAADNGTCEAYERERIVAFLNAPATLAFSPSIPYICGENSPPIQITATSTTQIDYLIDEDFESGGLGAFTQNNITDNGAATNAITMWQNRTSVFEPSENVWFPAISSGFGTNDFIMSNADSGVVPTENELESAVLDATNYLDLTLDLEMYFSRYNLTVPENVNIEVSTDGGATYPNVIANITDDVGYGTNFDFLSYDLSAFIGQPNLRVRIYYYSDWGDGVAIDNVKLYGTTSINPLATWTQPPGVQIYNDAAGTIPYTGDGRSVIYVVPSPAELQSSGTWSFNASVTLANGCVASGNVNLQNRTKYFMGTTNDWNDPNNWSPAGVPTSANCVVIPNTYSANITGTVDGDAYNLNVQNGGTLDIQTDGTLTVQNFVDVDATGQFTIENSGSLIQVQDQTHPDYVANTGDIDLNRNTLIRNTDWVFWSSPVANYGVTNISPTTSTNFIAEWLPTVVANTNGFGIWSVINENMIAGKGYIVRGPSAYTATPQNYTGTFTGTPHNGNITHPISRGSYNGGDYAGPSATIVTRDDDNLNLIGNPYPSALNAIDFLTANTDIEGSIRLWTHGTQISSANTDPFYAQEVQSYTINDFLIYNDTGSSSGPGTFNGYVGAGQSFFVLMEHTSATPSTVSFNNTMRDRTYTNADFFRAANENETNNAVAEKNRIWLNFITPSNQISKALVGYVSGATLNKDRMYDAIIFDNQDFGIYSTVADDRMAIQGRPVPFDNTDLVPLGTQIKENGIHTIAINAVDGLFDHGQDIYLEDLELGIIHDLKNAPYTFTASTGVYDNRFVLRYTNVVLGVDDFEIANELEIYASNQQITTLSKNNNIKTFIVYDMLGRVITNNSTVNALQYQFNMSNQSQGTYIVQVELINGAKLTKKVVL